MHRFLLILALVVLAAPRAAAQQGPQLEHYNLANQHTYLLTSYNVDWQAARAYSRTLGGYLAAINNPAEQTYIENAYGGTSYAYWIGLNDEAVEGTFVWDSGEPVTYTNWCSGEPNNYLGIEDYVEIFSVFTAGAPCWNDDSSPFGGYGTPATRGLVELPFGKRVNFDTASTSCSTSPFPTPLGKPSGPEGISWNGAGASLGRLPFVTNVADQGMPVTGSQYLRMVGTGIVNLPTGGWLTRPCPSTVNEIRMQIPPGTKGISLAFDFTTPETGAPYNDGLDISVVDALGNLVANVVYADVNGGAFATTTPPAFCYYAGAGSLLPAGPQGVARYLPVLPYPAYLSIACWNGIDDAVSSAVTVDAIQFWGANQFELDVSAPFGAGSIRLQNSHGTPSATYWTGVTLAQGSFPNGWLFGLDITLSELITQVRLGPPFSGTLNGTGSSSFTIGSGVPPGLPVYAVSIQFGPEPTASAPVAFVTF